MGVSSVLWVFVFSSWVLVYLETRKTDKQVRALIFSIDALAETIKTETRALEKRVTRLEERVDVMEK